MKCKRCKKVVHGPVKEYDPEHKIIAEIRGKTIYCTPCCKEMLDEMYTPYGFYVSDGVYVSAHTAVNFLKIGI